MRFYLEHHRFYCGIDLHKSRMYVCIIEAEGKVLFHRNVKAHAESFLNVIALYQKQDLVVAVEATFNWYWLADLCADLGIKFVLGHALAMKAIHGGKTKNDKLDSEKIARLLRGGNFPQAYVYPRELRSMRDLLRRRMCFVRRRAKLLTHIRHVNSQHNCSPLPANLLTIKTRQQLRVRFPDPATQFNVSADVALLEAYTAEIKKMEDFLEENAKVQDAATFYRLQSVPGIGKTLALLIMYEVGQITRFPSAGDFLSYARLVPGCHESDGKNYGSPGRKMGNPHLKWAFSEAAVMLLRECEEADRMVARLEKRHGKAKALSILAARLGRVVYQMLTRKESFDRERFFAVQQKQDRQLATS